MKRRVSKSQVSLDFFTKSACTSLGSPIDNNPVDSMDCITPDVTGKNNESNKIGGRGREGGREGGRESECVKGQKNVVYYVDTPLILDMDDMIGQIIAERDHQLLERRTHRHQHGEEEM